jgi:hypothetical protein
MLGPAVDYPERLPVLSTARVSTHAACSYHGMLYHSLPRVICLHRGYHGYTQGRVCVRARSIFLHRFPKLAKAPAAPSYVFCACYARTHARAHTHTYTHTHNLVCGFSMRAGARPGDQATAGPAGCVRRPGSSLREASLSRRRRRPGSCPSYQGPPAPPSATRQQPHRQQPHHAPQTGPQAPLPALKPRLAHSTPSRTVGGPPAAQRHQVSGLPSPSHIRVAPLYTGGRVAAAVSAAQPATLLHTRAHAR